ncbi:hypothetical protein T492DRAFT_1061771 [Pavlovales sp. CCMP2436]|nr:hypothetical protein T492DRAFT_1061771 [Pavlovales sp. CCMP2436]
MAWLGNGGGRLGAMGGSGRGRSSSAPSSTPVGFEFAKRALKRSSGSKDMTGGGDVDGGEEGALCYVCCDDDPLLRGELRVGTVCDCASLAVHIRPCLEALVNHPTRFAHSTTARLSCSVCLSLYRLPYSLKPRDPTLPVPLAPSGGGDTYDTFRAAPIGPPPIARRGDLRGRNGNVSLWRTPLASPRIVWVLLTLLSLGLLAVALALATSNVSYQVDSPANGPHGLPASPSGGRSARTAATAGSASTMVVGRSAQSCSPSASMQGGHSLALMNVGSALGGHSLNSTSPFGGERSRERRNSPFGRERSQGRGRQGGGGRGEQATHLSLSRWHSEQDAARGLAENAAASLQHERGLAQVAQLPHVSPVSRTSPVSQMSRASSVSQMSRVSPVSHLRACQGWQGEQRERGQRARSGHLAQADGVEGAEGAEPMHADSVEGSFSQRGQGAQADSRAGAPVSEEEADAAPHNSSPPQRDGSCTHAGARSSGAGGSSARLAQAVALSTPLSLSHWHGEQDAATTAAAALPGCNGCSASLGSSEHGPASAHGPVPRRSSAHHNGHGTLPGAPCVSSEPRAHDPLQATGSSSRRDEISP